MKKRWLNELIKEVTENDVALPWQRGARRTDLVDRQQDDATPRSASA